MLDENGKLIFGIEGACDVIDIGKIKKKILFNNSKNDKISM